MLDDMGAEGHCVCEAAKQQGIEALRMPLFAILSSAKAVVLPEPAWFAPQMITEDAYSSAQMLHEQRIGYLDGVMHERERCAQLFDIPSTISGEAEEWSRVVAARIRDA